MFCKGMAGSAHTYLRLPQLESLPKRHPWRLPSLAYSCAPSHGVRPSLTPSFPLTTERGEQPLSQIIRQSKRTQLGVFIEETEGWDICDHSDVLELGHSVCLEGRRRMLSCDLCTKKIRSLGTVI